MKLSCSNHCLGSLQSPGDLAFHPNDYREIVVKVDAVQKLASLSIDAQTSAGQWVALVTATPIGDLPLTSAGLHLSLTELPQRLGDMEFERIRLNWKTAAASSIGLQRIAAISR